jgi:sorbitol-specific phosphotransferase system component IIBC
MTDKLKCPLYHDFDGACCAENQCCVYSEHQTQHVELRATNVADPLLTIIRDMQYAVLGVMVIGLLLFGLPRFEHQQSTNDQSNQEAMR